MLYRQASNPTGLAEMLPAAVACAALSAPVPMIDDASIIRNMPPRLPTLVHSSVSYCPDSNSKQASLLLCPSFSHPPRSSHHLPRHHPLTSDRRTPCVSDTARTRRGPHFIDFPSPTTSTRSNRTPPHLVSLLQPLAIPLPSRHRSVFSGAQKPLTSLQLRRPKRIHSLLPSPRRLCPGLFHSGSWRGSGAVDIGRHFRHLLRNPI